ncbi:MAG: serine/threonine protein kinase [Planctomycetaceae bacterium]|nr:serine/threonine protein kinase [Planctomycetaceae bacterium]
MGSDREISDLISRSLSGELSVDQSGRLVAGVERSEQLRNFARLSSLIQDSVSDIGRKSGSDEASSVLPGLSSDARIRMKRSMALEQMKRSRTGNTSTGASLVRTVGYDGRTLPEVEAPPPSSRIMTSSFEFIRQLGEGGLGTVWLARDEQLRRVVAVKEMNAEAAENPRAWQRFHREAQITGHLEHPSVVPLYQFGTDTRTGQPFYAMRFVGKRTLVNAIEEYHQRLAAGKDVSMDQHYLLTTFISACQAIAYAHSRGVIHRDLKPENVALDSFGQVIVLDWGLARVSSDFETSMGAPLIPISQDHDFGRTLAGEVIGTPLYMAPEQAMGDQDRIDERTDVYGLGAILFAMLTGQAPHQAVTQADGRHIGIQEMLKQIATQPSPSPRSVRPAVPAGLETICMRAMEQHPHSRYQSALELAEAVQRWVAGRSEQREQYSNARSEGRELKTSLQSTVRDLERNVRFMAGIPPIQEMIDALVAGSASGMQAWRERLSQIFQGLLHANTDFASVSFCQVQEEEWRELVRVERLASDFSTVRAIPGSRLGSGPLTDCMQTALNLNPFEVHVALSNDCASGPTTPPKRQQKVSMLSAGVPVFDQKSEHLFGFVRIETSLDRLIENEMRERLRSTSDLIVLDNDCSVVLHLNQNSGRNRTSEGRAMTDFLSDWPEIRFALRNTGEFYDEQNHAIHATKVDLIPGRYSLAIVQSIKEKLLPRKECQRVSNCDVRAEI